MGAEQALLWPNTPLFPHIFHDPTAERLGPAGGGTPAPSEGLAPLPAEDTVTTASLQVREGSPHPGQALRPHGEPAEPEPVFPPRKVLSARWGEEEPPERFHRLP